MWPGAACVPCVRGRAVNSCSEAQRLKPLQVKCVPWLPSEPTAKKALDLVPVHCAMSAPVVTLREEMRIEDMRQVLREARHNGFPVVRDTAAGQVLPLHTPPLTIGWDHTSSDLGDPAC